MASIGQLPWLPGQADPVGIISRAIQLQQSQTDSGLRARALAQDASQANERMNFARQQANLEQQNFLANLIFKRQAQQAENQMLNTKLALSQRAADAEALEISAKAKMMAEQHAGRVDYEREIAAGVDPIQAILKHGPRMFAGTGAFANVLQSVESAKARKEIADTADSTRRFIADQNAATRKYVSDQSAKTQKEVQELRNQSKKPSVKEKLSPETLESIISSLSDLKSKGQKEASVDEAKGVARSPRLLTNDSPIDELIQEYGNRLRTSKKAPETSTTSTIPELEQPATGGTLVEQNGSIFRVFPDGEAEYVGPAK